MKKRICNLNLFNLGLSIFKSKSKATSNEKMEMKMKKQNILIFIISIFVTTLLANRITGYCRFMNQGGLLKIKPVHT